MASVSSLDKDLRNMRLSKYTPQAANEVRDWIENILHQKLQPGDLLDALRDGVALCRLVNLAVSPGVKFKESTMPFVQMENISHFLRACQMAPLSLPPHDVFLTVDLYERKDPAQVLQCIAAFSRRANAVQPSKFPYAIGGIKSKGGLMSPQGTGPNTGVGSRSRGFSNVSQTSSTNYNTAQSPASPPPTLSSWSKKSDEGTTAPAWNIHQYGYMGGASQGNQGVAFGARRQITTPSPAVPSLAEKEKKRREAERAEELHRQEEEMRRLEEEQRARIEEERRWAEETERLREKERLEIENEKKRWADEQKKWEEEEQRRRQEEVEAAQRIEQERARKRASSDARLNGQFLSQYQATKVEAESAESERIRQLERELELARERERQYEQERQDLKAKEAARTARERSRSRPRPVQPSYDFSSQEEERKLLRSEWDNQQKKVEPLEEQVTPPPALPARSLPDPAVASSPSSRPLPDPTKYTAGRDSRVDRFLASNPAPVQPRPVAHRPQDYSTTSEVDAENDRRIASQQKTKAGGWASKSLLEREMERERERQREWEENQKRTADAAKRGVGNGTSTAPGQGAWDVHQYGYLGGDSQNRGGTGLGISGPRRQIIGPRPPP